MQRWDAKRIKQNLVHQTAYHGYETDKLCYVSVLYCFSSHRASFYPKTNMIRIKIDFGKKK